MDERLNRNKLGTSRASATARWLIGLVLMAVSCATALGQTGTEALIIKPVWRPDAPPHPEQWKERYFVDDHEPPRPSAKESARGFVLYSRPSLSLVLDNSVPHGDDQVDRLSCSAALDEYETMTFAVYALRDLKQVNVEISELVNDEGQSRIPRRQIQTHVARGLHKRLAGWRGSGHDFMYLPSWLSDQDQVDMSARESAWFWVTVQVPDDAAPGTYGGTLKVHVGRQEKASLPIEVRVLPIQLETLSGYSIGYYDYVDHRTAPSWSTVERFKQMRAYGMTTVHVGLTDRLKIWLDDRGKLQVDFTGSSFVRAQKAYKEAGFPAPPTISLSGSIMNPCRRLADSRSVRYAELYLAALKALKAECDRNDWPLPILSPRDEPTGHPHTYHFVAHHLRLIKQAGLFTELNHFMAYPHNTNHWLAACLPYLDVITLSYSTGVSAQGQPGWADCAKLAHDYGKSLFTYNALQPGSVQPTSWRFLTGWFFRTWGQDCTGSFFYTFDYPDTDPYNDLEPRKGGAYGESVRAWYRPDPQRGMPGGPSTTIAWAREGIDDLRYIVTLERLIWRAHYDDPRPEAKQAAADAKEALNAIKESFDFSDAPHVMNPRGATAQSAWQSTGERDGLPVAGGEYLYNCGWGPADYDLARGKIVKQIIKLQALLGGGGS